MLAGRPVRRGGELLGVEPQLLLRLQRIGREPAIESLPIPEGRLATARQAALVAGDQPIGSVRDLDAGGVPARLYVPRGLAASEASGLLVYFHGGGFVYGDLETHDAVCRVLAEQAGVRVLAVDYRLAPEAPWPAAVDDAVAAYRWVVEHADELAADPGRIAVGGDSAGGNLAALVAIAAARAGWRCAFQLLVYPVTDMTASMESRRTFGTGLFLTTRFMDLGRDTYVPDRGSWTDPRVSPLFAELPEGLAPAYVATAALDPLRDEGEAYAARLAEAGAKVETRCFGGQIHGFVNMVGVGRSGPAAVAEIAAALRAAIG
ncbi:alpha/beta hydrolase [Nocardioides gansuensis]|uniref:Alpha/beta hydrolase n=2 Tax=Nocardioides gansuensis TaxID=2138300 RepID=A0A2T8FGN8_9ACTN|nr:alpha/beta hydrolase [Nocardioides gansuensis]